MKKIDFLKYRYVFYIISILIIVSGITFGFVKGFKFDLDFKGGTNIQFEVNEEFDNTQIEQIVREITGQNPLIQKLSSGNNSVSITTESLSNETVDSVVAKLNDKYTKMGEASIKNVQPSYGKEIVNSGVSAIIIAVILLLIYIGIRFRLLGFTAAVTAVAGLVHDILIMISFYVIFRFTINSSFVAVILTILGYSINDTIIVYDRIRENRRKVTRNEDLKDVINDSVVQTMSRTIKTAITTSTAISCVYVFSVFTNQTVLKDFSLPLLIGVLTGTYSSIFVSTALWYSTDKFIKKHTKEKVKGKVKIKR